MFESVLCYGHFLKGLAIRPRVVDIFGFNLLNSEVPRIGKIHLTDDRDCFGLVMFPEEKGHKDIRW